MSTGIIPGMGSANERRRYIVMSSLTDWAQTQTSNYIAKNSIFAQQTAPHIAVMNLLAHNENNNNVWQVTTNIFAEI